jgi:hypothetical protein
MQHEARLSRERARYKAEKIARRSGARLGRHLFKSPVGDADFPSWAVDAAHRGLRDVVSDAMNVEPSPQIFRECYAVKLGDFVKIGHSGGVKSRLVSLNAGSPWPYELLCIAPGGHSVEVAIHRHWSKWRHKGEWFALPENEVRALRLLGLDFADRLERVAKSLKAAQVDFILPRTDNSRVKV